MHRWTLQILLLGIFIPSVLMAREVTFSWDPFEGATGYEIQVSESSTFEKPVIQKKIKEPSLSVDLTMGHYFYRVRAIDVEKRPGYWSESMKIIVRPYPPELIEPKSNMIFAYHEAPPKIQLQWKETEGEPIYQVLVTKTTGEKVFEKTTKETAVDVNVLKEGEYFWKVRTKYKDKFFSDYVEPRKLEVVLYKLKPPKLISPENNSEVPSYRPIELEWQKDPSANYTDVTVQKLVGKKYKTIVRKKNVEGNQYTVNETQPGKYKWKVKTKETPETKGLESETFSFTSKTRVLADDAYGFSFGYSFYSDSTSSVSNQTGTTQTESLSSSALLKALDAHYFYSPAGGFQLELMQGQLSTDDGKLPYHNTTLTYRLRFGKSVYNQHVFIGYRWMSLYEINKATSTHNKFNSKGIVLGTQFNGAVHKKWRLGIEALYYGVTDTLEDIGDLRSDNYEGTLKVSWNAFYKFWLNYHFKFTYSVNGIKPDMTSESSSWTTQAIQPFYISLSLIH